MTLTKIARVNSEMLHTRFEQEDVRTTLYASGNETPMVAEASAFYITLSSPHWSQSTFEATRGQPQVAHPEPGGGCDGRVSGGGGFRDWIAQAITKAGPIRAVLGVEPETNSSSAKKGSGDRFQSPLSSCRNQTQQHLTHSLRSSPPVRPPLQDEDLPRQSTLFKTLF